MPEVDASPLPNMGCSMDDTGSGTVTGHLEQTGSGSDALEAAEVNFGKLCLFFE